MSLTSSQEATMRNRLLLLCVCGCVSMCVCVAVCLWVGVSVCREGKERDFNKGV